MSISEDRWFEIWYVDGEEVEPSSILIVTPDRNNPDCVVVLDPQDNHAVVHKGQSYEDTRLWLREDEYSLIKGRVFPDDGW
jgi:hypothetical protein